MSFIVAASVRDGRKRLDPIETGEADETHETTATRRRSRTI
jgi:hypothetical protein